MVGKLLLSYKKYIFSTFIWFFSENLSAVSDNDEHGKRFNQGISSIEKRYQVKRIFSIYASRLLLDIRKKCPSGKKLSKSKLVYVN